MKNWKMVRNITLIILIFFLVFIGKIAIEEFLGGNYYCDYMGITIFYWYDRFLFTAGIYFFLGGIPLIIDIIFLILSIIKIKRLKKEEMSK